MIPSIHRTVWRVRETDMNKKVYGGGGGGQYNILPLTNFKFDIKGDYFDPEC